MAQAVGPMSWSVTLNEPQYQELHEWLVRSDGDEHAAFLICGLARIGDANRLLVRQVVPVADDDFTLDASGLHYRIAASSVARAARIASEEGMGVVWVHSHPLQSVATLSPQ